MKHLSNLIILLSSTALVASASTPAKNFGSVKKAPLKVSSLQAPVVLPATDITYEGFTANWQATPGADGYAVFVTEKLTAPNDGRYTLLFEDFNLVYQGSVVEPVFVEEMTSDLDKYNVTKTPNWTVSQCIFAGGKIGGVIWSPYMDVRADGGKYRVTMTIYGYKGQEIMVVSQGTKEESKKFILEDNGNNTVDLDFTNGSQDTFMRIVDNGFPDDTEGLYLDKIAYLDDFEVSQDLKKGDEVYRLVAVGETEETSLSFAELPYRDNATCLYVDLYATAFYYPDPEDDWNYEVEYSPFSDKQEVLLLGHTSVDSVAISDGGIKVAGSTVSCDGDFVVYDFSGRVVAKAAGQTSLAPGLYIVKAGEKVAKISVK